MTTILSHYNTSLRPGAFSSFYWALSYYYIIISAADYKVFMYLVTDILAPLCASAELFIHGLCSAVTNII